MKNNLRLAALFFVGVVACGCSSSGSSAQSKQLVGNWKLVKAGEEAPTAIGIQLQQIDFAADGKWTSKINFQIPGFGVADQFTNTGTWSLSGATLTCVPTP